MRKITRRLQALADKAAQIQQAVASVPPKIMDVREAVVGTAGQLQQLRAELQGAVTGLRADTEDRLLEALRELDAGRDTLRRAGFELVGADLDLGLNRRLTAHLTWAEDISERTLREVLASCVSRPTLHALISALLQAGAIADSVTLDSLSCDGFVVHLGAAPVVRVCWRTPAEDEVAAPAVPTPAGQPAPVAVAAAETSAFTSTTYFEPRPRAAAAIQAPATPGVAAMSAAAAGSTVPLPAAVPGAVPVPAAGDWRRGALDRFKRMPDLSGPRRA